MKFRPLSRTGLIVAILIFGGLSFGTGYGVRAFSSDSSFSPTSSLIPVWAAATKGPGVLGSPDLKTVETLWEVLDDLKRHYVDPNLDKEALTDGAIRGMLESLGDRHTRYMNPSEYKDFQLDNAGEFEGIGAQLGVFRDDKTGAERLLIVKPLAGTPAAKAGLQAKDEVVKIDGVSTQGMTLEDAVNKIRGPRGSEVTLTVVRQGVDKPIDVALIRDVIEIHPVEYRFVDDKDKIGYIWLNQFNEKSEQELDKAMSDLRKQGMRALVFDLRSDPGGLLDVAVNVASKFIKQSPVVITRGRDGDNEALPVNPEKYLNLNMPIVVLVNEGSASAAEIVAGAIQDNGAAPLVGTHTYGKASVQVVVKLRNGGALAITTAKYLTPKRRDISKKGIMPDVVVEMDPHDKDDVQLQKAKEMLLARLADLAATSKTKVSGNTPPPTATAAAAH